MKPRALDLFCGAGGATKGLQRAGFYVVGVDVAGQPHYCGDEFHQADAMTYPLEGFDFIWASPPCQFYTVSAFNNRKRGIKYPDLVPAVCARLRSQRTPYCIENVVGAPLVATVVLDGYMFPQLRVIRRRIFETSFFVLHPDSHPPKNLISQGYSCVVGGGRCSGAPVASNAWHTQAAKQRAMGIDWKMTRKELANAVPPTYAEFIARIAREEARRG